MEPGGADAAQLEVLLAHPYRVEHARMDPITQLALHASGDPDVLHALTQNPDLAPEVQELLLGEHASLLALNPNPTREVQAQLAVDESSVTRTRLAGNPGISEEAQTQLAGDPDSSVQRALAENPNLTPHAAALLLQTGDEKLAASLGRNPALSKELQGELLARDRSGLNLALADNPNLATMHQHTLLGKHGWSLDQVLSANPALTPALQERLSRNRTLHRTLAHNRALTPEVQEALLEGGDLEVWAHLASNPALTPFVQGALAGAEEKTVLLTLAENPALLTPLQERFASGDPAERRALARNPHLAPHLQVQLARDSETAAALTQNPNLEVTGEFPVPFCRAYDPAHLDEVRDKHSLRRDTWDVMVQEWWLSVDELVTFVQRVET